jgi:CheY-like chemotaxis protein
VLVADDGGALAAAAIACWGEGVEVAADGLDALRRARARPPDLVLAPARLGRMSGVSLLAAIRAGGPGGTAFVLVAGPEDRAARERARLLGATAVLEAPVDVADLARVALRAAGWSAVAAAAAR